MNFKVEQFRKGLRRLIDKARAEIAAREQGISKAEQTLAMLESFAGKSKPKKARPEGALGISDAIRKVLNPDTGSRIGVLVEKVVALKPHSNSVNLPSTIAATIAILQKRGEIKRKQTKEGWVYFAKREKSAKAA